MSILGIVIIYHPDSAQLKHNIEQYINYIDRLIVWNNTPHEDITKYKSLFSNAVYKSKLEFVFNNLGNQGLCVPLNYARKQAIEQRYDYLLTMDQDSEWLNFKLYKEYITIRKLHGSIFTPSINGTVATNITLAKREKPVIELINSGTIYPLDVLISLGHFDNNLFVEGIDTEIGLRCSRNNIDIYTVNGAVLHQTYSSPAYPPVIRHFHRLRTKFIIRNTNKKRIKEIVASCIYLRYKYPEHKRLILKHLFCMYGIKYLIFVILFEKDKIEKLTEYFKGFSYGRKIYKKSLSEVFVP